MKLPARVTDPDGIPGVAVRVVAVSDGCAFEVVGPDHIIRQFPAVDEGWPEKRSPYDAFLHGV